MLQASPACDQPNSCCHCSMQACKSVLEALQLRSDLATPEMTAAIGGCEPALHMPLRQLLFRDFSEALVRVAQLKFQHLPSPQQRLHQLLHNLILPHAVKVRLCCCTQRCCACWTRSGLERSQWLGCRHHALLVAARYSCAGLSSVSSVSMDLHSCYTLTLLIYMCTRVTSLLNACA